MGGPFRSTSPTGKPPQPNVRVVYEKPIEGAEALGKRLGAEAKSTRSRFDYICRGLNALQLGQRNAAEAASSAINAIGLRMSRLTVGDDVVLTSVMPGAAKPILVIKPDGTVLRGRADIAIRSPIDPQNPLELANIVEDAPLIPGG